MASLLRVRAAAYSKRSRWTPARHVKGAGREAGLELDLTSVRTDSVEEVKRFLMLANPAEGEGQAGS